MSKSKARKLQFFNNHPFCCFCGGAEAATTEDHIPGRAIFENRVWPEGYVFPACQKCNAESSDDEIVVSIIGTISENHKKTDTQTKEFKRRIANFARQRPDLYQSLKFLSRSSEIQKFKQNNIPAWNPNTNLQRKMVLMPKEMMEMTSNFGIKLGKALHYLHSGKIVPQAAIIKSKAFTNAEITKLDEDFTEKINLIPHAPGIVRSTKPLNDQFAYKYVFTDNHMQSVFAVVFGKDSLLLLITIDVTGEIDRKIS